MTKTEWVNKRVRVLIKQGYTGPQASDKARAEWARGGGGTRSNPMLAVVGENFNPPKKIKKAAKKGKKSPARRNFDLSLSEKAPKTRGGVKLVAKDVPIESLKKHKHFKLSHAQYKKFHGYEGRKATVYEIKDGRDDVEIVMVLGKTPQIDYFIDEGQKSNKEGYRWQHHTKKGSEMILVYNPVTKIMSYLPPDDGSDGTRVADWLREDNE